NYGVRGSGFHWSTTINC
ncbi:hypothetical protein D030_5370B, partial [Vibrio parahaemolyticus AQ3810]